MTIVSTLTCTCKRCQGTKVQKGSWTVGRRYPFSCCGVVQMATA